MTQGLSTDVITDPHDLDSLVAPWRDLLGPESASPTLQPRWYLAAAHTLYDDGELHVPVVTRGNEIVAVAPAGRQRGRSHLEVLGANDVYEPSGLAYRDAESLDVLVGALVSTRRALHLGRLASDGPTLRSLTSLPRHRALTALRETSGTPFVPISGDWDAFESSMSKDRRSSLRRNRRRADEAGGLEFDVVAPGPDDVDDHFDEFVATEHRSWKGENGTSLAVDDRLRRFYRTYVRVAATDGDLRVSRVRIGGESAAVQLAIERANRLWILKLGADERFSKCAPGIVLTHETIRWAFEHGLEGYELLGQDAPWTRAWTDQVHPFTTARTYPLGVRGVRAAVGDVATQARKRARRDAA